jgi:UDP-glucose 4-epimerase
VLHQAAIPSVPRSVNEPVTSNRANIDATLNVLVAAATPASSVSSSPGSSSAYGDTPTLPKREDMPTNPLSPYALQKLVGEQYMQLFTRSTGSRPWPSATSTCSGPARIPRRPTRASSRCSSSALLDGAPPVIYGDGEQTRDFTYVANVVDGVLRACRRAGRERRGDQRGDRRARRRSTSCSGRSAI